MGWELSWQEQLAILYSLEHWWGYMTRLVTILLVASMARRLARRLVRRFFRYAVRDNRLVVSERRARTLEDLLSSLSTFVIFLTAFSAIILALNVADANVLLPTLGLFSAAFGLGARPLVSDYLAGITLLFEYSYAFGEKVEILDVIGTVESVGLRTTKIRADSGELFIVPNGDVRVIRNFSRGAFSPASVRVVIRADDLSRAIEVLEAVGQEVAQQHAELLVGTPEVLSETGELGLTTQLTLVAKARFSHGAQLRRILLEAVHRALSESGIEEGAPLSA